MGTEIARDEFGTGDYALFRQRLEQNLSELGLLLDRPGFGTGPQTIGAELELFLVDRAAQPLPLNQAVCAEAADPRITVELDRFNLELNSSPVLLAGHPFAELTSELGALLTRTDEACRAYQGQIALIGVLPTLSLAHLDVGAVTDTNRYRALGRGLARLRRGPIRIRIAGEEPLELTSEQIALEGANSSFQVHLRVAPARLHAGLQRSPAGHGAGARGGGELAHLPRPPALGGDQDRAVQAVGRRPRPPRAAATALARHDGHGLAAKRGPGTVRRERPPVRSAAALRRRGACPGQGTAARRTSPGRAEAPPEHGLALEPAHLRPRGGRPSADRDARPARRADRDGHAGQRRFPDRADPVAGRAGPAVDLCAAVRAG